MKKPKSAFVLMPFKDPFNSYYTKLFKPALEAAFYRVLRADDIFTPRPVMLDIQQSILEADLILCEMSERNPNVFYELGLAHAVGRPAVLVSQKVEDIPFDLRYIRTIFYDVKLPGWEEKLKQQITNAASAATGSSDRWPPPLISVETKPLIAVETSRLYTILGLLNEDPQESDDPHFQSFKVSKSNKNPLANFWSDPRPGNTLKANIVPELSLLRVSFESSVGCYSPAVGIHPEDLKARKVPDSCRWFKFQAWIGEESTVSSEVRAIAIRLVNGEAQHWQYQERTGEREIFELIPGERAEFSIDMRDPDRWGIFKGAGNFSCQLNPAFDVLASVIFEFGCKRNPRELGHGDGTVELFELIFQ